MKGTGGRPTRAEAIQRAGEIFAEGELSAAQRTPREQAEAAWTPTSRKSVDELEAQIRTDRGLPRTKAECIRRAGEVLAEAHLANQALSPRELAQGIWSPGDLRTVAEIEDEIRADRGLPPQPLR